MRRLYRMLLRLYPARFREEYAAPMESQFRDEYRDAESWAARARFSLRALADLALTLPAEAARELRQDLHYALRAYRQRSLAAVLALAALALAFGATTGIFSVLNAVLIRSLPFRDPERLAELWLSPVNVGEGRAPFRAKVAVSPYLEDASGYTTNQMNLTLAHDSARVQVTETAANFLRLLGAEPEYGRGFAPDEDLPGRNSVAVIGYGVWQQFFGGDPRVLGSTIRVNGTPLTIIGVAPRTFDYPEKTAIWTPTIFDFERIPKAGAFGSTTIGRLKPGVSMAQATAMFQAEVERESAGRPRPKIPGWTNQPELFSLRDRLAGPVRSASLVLMGVVFFVMLIACANVAHLLLSRVSDRRQELAVRAALGASRARLVQQLITEAIVLTGAAAIAGIAVAHWTARLAAIAQPAQLSARQYDVLDWRVIAFAIGLALLTGVVFGVLPVSLIRRMQPGQDAIRVRPGASASGRMRGILIAMQAALSVALAAGSFSMGRSFLKLLGTDLGYRTTNVVTLNVSLAGTRYGDQNRARQYYDDALQRLRAIPGVESAAAASYLPLVPIKMFIGGQFKLDTGGPGVLAASVQASSGYFRTMQTELVQGREFNDTDRSGSERVVIVSEDLARGLGVGTVLGRKLNLAWRGEPKWATIVGVVRSQRLSGPANGGLPQLFRPIEQSPPDFVTFVAKVRGNPEAYLAVCRDAVQQTDRQVPVYDVKTLDQRLADTLARPRFYTTAILFLTGFALLLAVIGAYGAAAYSVAQRTHEMGIRIAVGASPHRLRSMLLRQSMAPVAIGILAGAIGAVWLGRLLQHLIATAEPIGGWISAVAALTLAAATAVAVWTAIERIVRLDPTTALRVE